MALFMRSSPSTVHPSDVRRLFEQINQPSAWLASENVYNQQK